MLTPVQCLTILIDRAEKRAEVLEGVRLEAYTNAILEIQNIVRQMKGAREYLLKQQPLPPNKG